MLKALRQDGTGVGGTRRQSWVGQSEQKEVIGETDVRSRGGRDIGLLTGGHMDVFFKELPPSLSLVETGHEVKMRWV